MINKKIGCGVVIAEGVRPTHVKGKHKYWIVQCECGESCLVPSYSIRGNRWKSCGCLHEPDLINKQFGDGIVIKLVGPDGMGNRTWLLRCKCNKEYTATTNSLKTGNTKGCGCRNGRTGSRHPHYKGFENLSGDYWSKLKRGARIRDIVFKIDIEWAWNLFVKQKQKCALTGRNIVLSDGSFVGQTASLDRINSKLGYTKDNVQWVHKDINRMKQAFDESYFIGLCKEVSKHKEALSSV